MDRAKLIKKLKEFKKKIEKKYDINTILFFGSRASGKPYKDSDVDLIIVSKKFNGLSVLKRSPDLYLKWNPDYPVDFLCYTPQEFNKLKNKITIVKEAVETGIEIK